jgi:enamine deaminase RidA (YjgF/YER057c/UK114 family)
MHARLCPTRISVSLIEEHGRIHRKSDGSRPASDRKEPEQETQMTRRLISSGSTFEQEIGYSRAVVEGDWVFVSGTTGFDYSKMTISDDLLEQADQCFRNIGAALDEAGASMRDIVRVTYILPDAADFSKCWPIFRKYLGDVKPAAMMLAAGLSDPRMRIEIQVTARRGSGA